MAEMSVGRAPVGRMEVRLAMREEMMGLTLAEGTMLVRAEDSMQEVRFSKAEE
jgi:hypothetical protein